jgi:hypothetical protein
MRVGTNMYSTVSLCAGVVGGTDNVVHVGAFPSSHMLSACRPAVQLLASWQIDLPSDITGLRAPAVCVSQHKVSLLH